MWKAHYTGESFEVKQQNKKTTVADSLGICPINKNSQCTWGAIDLDEYKPDYKELFKKLLQTAGQVLTVINVYYFFFF